MTDVESCCAPAERCRAGALRGRRLLATVVVAVVEGGRARRGRRTARRHRHPRPRRRGRSGGAGSLVRRQRLPARRRADRLGDRHQAAAFVDHLVIDRDERGEAAQHARLERHLHDLPLERALVLAVAVEAILEVSQVHARPRRQQRRVGRRLQRASASSTRSSLSTSSASPAPPSAARRFMKPACTA
ncbi:MAG: hypothetical protein FJ137_22640 [Deltaproteobacteria bacterium]|nr:hypothetical protein [Deltaproteobacteria bacterium]